MSAMGDVVRVAGLWRGRSGRLLAGMALAVAALLCGVGLIAAAGRVSVGAAMAAGAAAALLHVLGVGRIVGRYAERLVTHDATFRALADLRVWFFRRVAASAAGGLGFRRSGDLLSRLVADVEALDALYLRVLVPLAGAVVLIPVVLVVLRRDPWLAVGLAALLAMSALVLPAVAARLAVGAGTGLARAEAALRVSVLDAIGGARELRVFGAEGRATAQMQERQARLIGAQLALARRASMADTGAFLLGQAAVLAVLVAVSFGAGGLGGAGADAGYAAVAVFLVLASFEAVGGMPRAGVLAGYAAAAARRVLEAADAGGGQAWSGAAPVGAPGAAPVGASGAAPAAAAAAVPGSSAITFEGVSFGWAPGRAVLQGMSLEVPDGGRVALLGPSGSGKSTVAQLLLGLARPAEGRILLGGVDIATLPADAVRRRVALLSQATHNFADTIRANLLIGRREASEAQMWAALDQAAVGDWVRGLPEGLDTWLGEGGATVSGGQARRLALARTLLSDASVIVLDEPASGLDGETERRFLLTLFAAEERRTVVLIAHRLTGVERLDRIWRLQGGRATAAAA